MKVWRVHCEGQNHQKKCNQSRLNLAECHLCGQSNKQCIINGINAWNNHIKQELHQGIRIQFLLVPT